MKKIYATLVLSSLVFAANAQDGMRKVSKTAATTTAAAKFGNPSTSALVCDTLTTIGANDTLMLYTVGQANGGGYVAGNNGYGDLAKATFMPGSMLQPASTVSGVIAQFFRDVTNNRGTKGSGNITMSIMGGDTTNGPTTSLGSVTVPLSTVISSGVQTGNSLLFAFSYTTAVSAPSTGFFSSLTLPTATGDTAALFLSQNSQASAYNYGWEMWSPSGWYSFGYSWGLPTSLSLYPIVCYNTTGIHNNSLEAGFGMYPNPTNGVLNFAVSLPEATNLNVSVSNTLGQVVFTAMEKNVQGGVFTYDLTTMPKGMYTATISDSNNNKVVRKIVVQ